MKLKTVKGAVNLLSKPITVRVTVNEIGKSISFSDDKTFIAQVKLDDIMPFINECIEQGA